MSWMSFLNLYDVAFGMIKISLNEVKGNKKNFGWKIKFLQWSENFFLKMIMKFFLLVKKN